MAVEKMSLIAIAGRESELYSTALECVESESLHAAYPGKLVDLSRYPEFKPMSSGEDYSSLVAKLEGMASELGIEVTEPESENLPSAEEIKDYVYKLDKKLSELGKLSEGNKRRIEELSLAESSLSHLKGLDVSLGELLSLEYVSVRFGRLPRENRERLELYTKVVFEFIPLDVDRHYFWGLYLTPTSMEKETDKIFESLMFNRISIPDFCKGTPEESAVHIAKLKREADYENIKLKNDLKRIALENKESIPLFLKAAAMLEQSQRIKENAVGFNGNFFIAGYVLSSQEDEIKRKLEKLKTVSETSKPADKDKNTPTKLKNGRFAKPFESVVRMYGLPEYGQTDPTLLVAVTYTLMFGMMFGDLGQGAVIAAVGYFIWRLKKLQIGRIFLRIGLSSAFFGLIYGSFFGVEDAFDSFYRKLGFSSKPIELLSPDTAQAVLMLSVIMGVVMTAVSIVLNIFAGIKNKDFEKAVLGANGAAGLIFYLSVFFSAGFLIFLQINVLNPTFITLCIIIPFIFMLLPSSVTSEKEKKSQDLKAPLWERIAQGFFEMFESLLSYVTNTMSFLRVGGFILSHAGMMAVVMTLSEMVGRSSSLLVMAVGNLFVMAMEGLVVGIQALRLEFYEIFSRFYEGGGKEYRPAMANIRHLDNK